MGEREKEGGRGGERGRERSSSREWNMKIFGIWTEFVAFPQPRRLCSSRTNRKRRRNCVRRDNSSLCTSRTYLLFTAGYVRRMYSYTYVCVRLCAYVPSGKWLGFVPRFRRFRIKRQYRWRGAAARQCTVYSVTLPSTNAERVLSD